MKHEHAAVVLDFSANGIGIIRAWPEEESMFTRLTRRDLIVSENQDWQIAGYVPAL